MNYYHNPSQLDQATVTKVDNWNEQQLSQLVTELSAVSAIERLIFPSLGLGLGSQTAAKLGMWADKVARCNLGAPHTSVLQIVNSVIKLLHRRLSACRETVTCTITQLMAPGECQCFSRY